MKNLNITTIPAFVKRPLLLLTLISGSALLVACGGGGGNGAAAPTNALPAPTVTASAESSQKTIPLNTQLIANSSAYDDMTVVGSAQKIEILRTPTDIHDQNPTPEMAPSTDTTVAYAGDTNSINVDGHKITLKNYDPATFNSANADYIYKDNTSVGSAIKNLSYASWGVLSDLKTDYSYAYDIGQQTQVSDMPTTGTANYEGAFALNAYTNTTINTRVGNDARFTADFANKTLRGTIASPSLNMIINLSATINGNRFSGTSDSGVQTTGGFYGPQAAELAGGFVDPKNNVVGAFGAKKVQ